MTTPALNQRHALTFVLITVLIDTIGLGIIMPVTPALIRELTGEGLSAAAVYGGWLAFVFAVMQFLSAPVLGNLSDRFGRRPVLLLSLAALGVDYIIMGLAPTLAWLFLGRALAGIAGASYTPAYAYVADISPPSARARNFGIIGAGFGGGFIIGPAVGGILGEYGTRIPFFVAAALSLLNVIYGYFVLPESLPPESRRRFQWKRSNPLGTLVQMRKQGTVMRLLAVLFLWELATQVFPSIWPFYTMYRFGWSPAAVGWSLAFVGVVFSFSQVLTGPVVKRFGEGRTTLYGIVFGILGYLGYVFATQGWMMYAWLSVWFVAGFVMPAVTAMASHRVSNDAQGELQGAIACCYSLAAILGPPLMTQLFGRFSGESAPADFPAAPFLCALLLSLVCLLIFRPTLNGKAAAAAASGGQG